MQALLLQTGYEKLPASKLAEVGLLRTLLDTRVSVLLVDPEVVELWEVGAVKAVTQTVAFLDKLWTCLAAKGVQMKLDRRLMRCLSAFISQQGKSVHYTAVHVHARRHEKAQLELVTWRRGD